MAFICRHCHENPDRCINLQVGALSQGPCVNCGRSQGCSDCRCSVIHSSCSKCSHGIDIQYECLECLKLHMSKLKEEFYKSNKERYELRKKLEVVQTKLKLTQAEKKVDSGVSLTLLRKWAEFGHRFLDGITCQEEVSSLVLDSEEFLKELPQYGKDHENRYQPLNNPVPNQKNLYPAKGLGGESKECSACKYEEEDEDALLLPTEAHDKDCRQVNPLVESTIITAVLKKLLPKWDSKDLFSFWSFVRRLQDENS